MLAIRKRSEGPTSLAIPRIFRSWITVFTFCFIAPGLFAQDKTVVPISKPGFNGWGVKIHFGSGFCLDTDCRFVVTNYHVAKAMGDLFSIQGEPIVNVWLDSGRDDEGATKLG